MTSKARVIQATIQEVSPGRTADAFHEVGGPYEGNNWLRSESRYRAEITFEWRGDGIPDEVRQLLERYRRSPS